jgi:hypothetical protein
MKKETSAGQFQQIANWIYEGATAKPRRPGRRLQGSQPASDFASRLTTALRSQRIHTALHRAATKTFVRAIKPFRRILRNQGAVNDSLIEASHELSIQYEELNAELLALRAEMEALRKELNRER